MAVMDTIEAQNATSVDIKTGHPNEGTVAIRVKTPPPGLRKNRAFVAGPSPAKGSGQDRFRRMLAKAPGVADVAASTIGAPAPEMSQAAARTSLLDFTSLSGPSYGRQAGCEGVSNSGSDAVLGAFFPALGQDMNKGNLVPAHRVAVNPAVYPAAANMAHAMMPYTPTGARALAMGGDFQAVGNNGYNSLAPLATTGNKDCATANGRGGDGKGFPNAPPYTALLSAECQRRRFNPQFNEWITMDGQFQCSVTLKGKIMHDMRKWNSPIEAKQALAKRAVDYVRTLPLPSGEPNKAAERVEQAQNAIIQHVTHKEAEEEERRLLARVQALFGNSGGPSDSTLQDPVASRAFLEGFALGTKLRNSSSGQRRSRSPHRGHRERSPIRRRDRSGSYVKRE
ncbi:hypothetical protein JX265_006175 [Neoarthrinium moseri]|uniref:Uncharacterized protein n=1 Tax=Neoarthrinium moseri TaxID=1658444 RepID=A0A9P9WMI2_9PEZI|nr:hypothetical protein JX265_006175 [Neoarthrinium moseri]